jgi:hypothetical protein
MKCIKSNPCVLRVTAIEVSLKLEFYVVIELNAYYIVN